MVSRLPLIEVVDLCFRHPGRSHPTIAGVNLTLNPGEIVLIAGATGSGKSTLLNCLTGIAPNHTGGELHGKIGFQGTDIREWSVRQRSRHFCTILQNVEIQIFTDRVWEELAFGLENWNVPATQIPPLIDTSLQNFGLDNQRDWFIRQLSAGQKQRLLLACLLATGQPVLLLDEPLAYLDAKGVKQLLQLLRSRADEGQSVLLIEHRLDVVSEICDRAYSFEDGKLVEGRSQQAGSQEPGVRSQEPGKEGDAGTRGHRDTETKAEGRGQRAEGDTGKQGHGDTGKLIQNSKFKIQNLELNTQNSSPIPHTPHPTPDLLQTHQLSWGGYPPFPDLQVKAGETVLLQGDNGCGKTTLLKLLSGLLKPTTGTLEILGRNRRNRSVVEISKDVGFVLQNPNHQLFADSVRSEVLQPGVSAERANTLLERLNLGDRADRHPQSLSQGQKRRLALGAVLARQPKICLLDEITVGQDPQSLALMLRVLREFTTQGSALILTSHDPLAAAALNARIVQIGVA
ncbi:ATP-binding cassette domain-containing protein [Kovacikia minuta CCNUW1]|uniref:ABC transporter ATP-binding protein n=1 Tax=Kovacikia minuta TaxID=2931930 RepID=UPI001CD020A5|nr:ABC transporter ATP-binding protein [Kovacikia minuta]UBF27930.1 ATP-binding cassette domain-containing protein [Kovacikia minuta CCNUW1]